MSKHTLLIVDDEPNVLKSLKRLLIDTDYKIITAASAEEAIDKFVNNEIHVVISDYRMPGMNGVEFLTKVKEKWPDTIRLILSGYADAIAIVEAINEGQVYRFITKPWNDQELLTTIMRTFEQYDLQRENVKLYSELQERNRELQELARSLEEKVSERTRDLEIKNRALMMARNILNYLPAGVIGVDSEEMVVYMNESLQSYFVDQHLFLGMNAREALDDGLYEILRNTLEKQQVVHKSIDGYEQIDTIWSPLPHRGGAIGIFVYSDPAKYGMLKPEISAKIGAGNGE